MTPPAPRTAIVTGAGRGIGLAIARRLALEGYSVAIAEIAPSTGQAAASLVPHSLFIHTDMADERSIAAMVERAAEELGPPSVLINNAAISANGPLAGLTRAAWERVLAVNLTGPMLLVKFAEKHLRAAKGAVVNIASTRANMSEPHTEAYSAAKGGLVALTHALAMSLAPDVRVNSISPGWINTTGEALRPEDHSQHPVGRVGTPEDIAEMAAYLVSERAGFVTGQDFIVDGGMTRKMIYML